MLLLLVVFLRMSWLQKYTHAGIVDPDYYNDIFGNHDSVEHEITKRYTRHKHVKVCSHDLTCPESHYTGHGSVESLMVHCTGAHERAVECHLDHHHHSHHQNDYGDYDECYGKSNYDYNRRRRNNIVHLVNKINLLCFYHSHHTDKCI